MVKKIFLIALLLGILAAGYGLYQYYKPVSGLENVTPDYSTDADSFFNDFLIDEDAANKKYLGKVIEITGVVRNKVVADSGKYIVNLKTDDDIFGISCEINVSKNYLVKDLKAGDKIKVKGKCSGKLMDIVLVNCFIEKNK